jgi:AraC-like DNA-binding protein
MPVTSARVALESNASQAQASGAPTRAWRPFHTEVGDLLCVEEAYDDVQARIHGRFSVTVLRSAAVVRCESSRSLVAARNSVLVVPAWHLYSLRPQSRPTGATVTLLVGASHLNGLATDRAAIVTDGALVEQVEALVTQLSRPMVSLECATTLGSVLARLTASGAPVGSLLPRQGTPLGAARDYLRARSSEPVTIAELARMMGLAESHLIRAFHREFGLPPHAYQMRLRLAAACELLSRGLAVSTVAFECGFADQSHLSRNFKSVYGMTPAAWASAVATVVRRSARAGALRNIARAPTRDLRLARVMDA